MDGYSFFKMHLITVVFFGLRLALFAAEPSIPPERPCHQLLTAILESRDLAFANERVVLRSLASRIQRQDLKPSELEIDLPLSPKQLSTLVKIKLALRSGELSLKALNDLEMAIDPDLRNAGVQSDTPETLMSRFDDLLAYLHVTKAFNRHGPKLEREILETKDDAETKIQRAAAKVDRIVREMVGRLGLDSEHRRALLKKLYQENPKLNDHERKFLRRLATQARSYTADESLIAWRIADNLSQLSMDLPLAVATAASIPGNRLSRDDLILPRMSIEVAISQNFDHFNEAASDLSRRRQIALMSFKARFKVHVENGGVMTYDPRESAAALDVLESALRVSRDPNRTYQDFARWALGNRIAPSSAVEFLKSVERKRNTFSHRLYNWMNFTKMGFLTAIVTASVGIGSSGLNIAHYAYDPRYPTYTQQWEIVKQKSVDWFNQIKNSNAK